MNVTTLLQTFARDKDGQLVSIGDVARGLACDCQCPLCHAPLVARQGGMRVWHFAHVTAAQCIGAAESALHLAAKEIIRKAGGVTLPEFTIQRTIEGIRGVVGHGQATHPSAWIDFSQVLIEESVGAIRPDIVGVSGATRYIVEIKVTHGVDEEKINKIVDSGMPAIEISLDPSAAQSWDWAELEAIVLDSLECRRWIYFPNAEVLTLQAMSLASEDLERQIALLPPENNYPIKHGFKMLGMNIYVTERDFGTTVWSSYHPEVSAFLSSVCKQLGGRWKREYKNWLLSRFVTDELLDRVRRGCEEAPLN